MVLQDVHRLPALCDAGVLATAHLLEVDEERQGVLAGWHDIDGALQHVDQMMQLLRARFGVLFRRVQVETRAPFSVEAELDLLARFVLYRDVFRVEAFNALRTFTFAIFTAPHQGCPQSCHRGGEIPIGGAQVAQETVAGQPHALVIHDWGCRCIFG